VKVIRVHNPGDQVTLGHPSSDVYDSIARQVEQENQLINQRLTWTLQLNGFLFTAIALLSGKPLHDKGLALLLKWLIPLTGLSLSLAGLLGVLAAQWQLLYLTQRWQAQLQSDPRPRPFGDMRHSYLIGAVPSVLPPAALSCVWGVMARSRVLG